MTRVLTMAAILLMWPFWTIRACFLAAAGVALLVARAIAAEWGRA